MWPGGETNHNSLFGTLQLRVWPGGGQTIILNLLLTVEGVARGESDHRSLFGALQLRVWPGERQTIILYLVLYS